jgi:hypothetical protein
MIHILVVAGSGRVARQRSLKVVPLDPAVLVVNLISPHHSTVMHAPSCTHRPARTVLPRTHTPYTLLVYTQPPSRHGRAPATTQGTNRANRGDTRRRSLPPDCRCGARSGRVRALLHRGTRYRRLDRRSTQIDRRTAPIHEPAQGSPVAQCAPAPSDILQSALRELGARCRSGSAGKRGGRPVQCTRRERRRTHGSGRGHRRCPR